MASEILLATRSRDKAAEIVELVASVATARLTSLSELGIEASASEDNLEVHLTFIENAMAKARYFADLTGRITLADDSGLMVDALSGQPGVRTKRFASDHGIEAIDRDQANNDLLLEQLKAVPDERRGAQYVCAAAFARPDGTTLTAVGTCSGRIAHARRGTGGFGYDPLFLIPDLDVTFAQLTRLEKNQSSHRAHAVRALAAHMK